MLGVYGSRQLHPAGAPRLRKARTPDKPSLQEPTWRKGGGICLPPDYFSPPGSTCSIAADVAWSLSIVLGNEHAELECWLRVSPRTHNLESPPATTGPLDIVRLPGIAPGTASTRSDRASGARAPENPNTTPSPKNPRQGPERNEPRVQLPPYTHHSVMTLPRCVMPLAQETPLPRDVIPPHPGIPPLRGPGPEPAPLSH